MKRLLFPYSTFVPIDGTFQVFSYKGTSKIGSRLLTRRQTMILSGAHTIKEPEHGFWRVMY